MSTYDHEHFERLYETKIDPWQFRDSVYEAEKYRATIDALPAARFAKCLELGCSIGVLTRMLASRCDSIVAVDTSAKALAEASRECHGLPVRFKQCHLPEGEFGNAFDLVVASEVLYYLEPAALTRLADRLTQCVTPGALCIAVHWTGATDYPMSADAATQLFERSASLERISYLATAAYRLDVWKFSNGSLGAIATR